MDNQYKLSIITLILSICICSIAIGSLQDGLIVYYPFDEAAGKTASDKSKTDSDAELTGTATWAPNEGKIDGAVRFDGADGSVVDENGADYLNGLAAFTISVWVKSDSVGHDRGIIFGKDPAGGDDTFGFRYDSASWSVPGGTNLIKAGISTTGGGQSMEGQSDVQTDEWQHIVLTWLSGEQLALYVDGVLDDDPTHNADAQNGEISGVTKLLIGKGAKDNNGTSWTGLIDEVRIYDRSLELNEIEELASGILPVEPNDKLTTIWGNIKTEK